MYISTGGGQLILLQVFLSPLQMTEYRQDQLCRWPASCGPDVEARYDTWGWTPNLGIVSTLELEARHIQVNMVEDCAPFPLFA